MPEIGVHRGSLKYSIEKKNNLRNMNLILN
jgi:hypothetical protein